MLGPERQGMLTIHSGRHSCASHLLAAGWPLPAVRDMLQLLLFGFSLERFALSLAPPIHLTTLIGRGRKPGETPIHPPKVIVVPALLWYLWSAKSLDILQVQPSRRTDILTD